MLENRVMKKGIKVATPALAKVALGGSCHWCTEAIFRSLKGVAEVEQGWLAATDSADALHEGIIIHFNPELISLGALVAVHLHTHSCTSQHALRHRYRSAVYAYSDPQCVEIAAVITGLAAEFNAPILTQAVMFHHFEPSRPENVDYYYRAPEKPFCQVRINPKLALLLAKFSEYMDSERKQLIERAING